MSFAAHQEKEKNEETKTGKRRAGEERKEKQAIDFEEAVCCPSAVSSGQRSVKMKGSGWGNWDPSGRPTAISTQPKRGWGPHHHVKAPVDWCRIFKFVYLLNSYIYIFNRYIQILFGCSIEYGHGYNLI